MTGLKVIREWGLQVVIFCRNAAVTLQLFK